MALSSRNGFFKFLLIVFVGCANQGHSSALTFNVCADDAQFIYVDGVLLNSQTKYYYVDLQVTIPASATIVAVKVINYSGPGGWKGYFSDGQVADGSRKCTSTAQADDKWTLASFDDSKWTAPVSTGASPDGCNKGSYSSAKWLWTEPTYLDDVTMYCRKKLDYCHPSPCQNGVCVNSATGYTCTCAAGYQGTNCDTTKFPLALKRLTVVTKASTGCLLTDPTFSYCLFFDGALKVYKSNVNGDKVGVPVWQVAGQFGSQREFSLQGDGNLCIHDGWCSYTHDDNCPAGSGGSSLVLLPTGQLAIRNAGANIIWITPSPVTGTTLTSVSTACCKRVASMIPGPCTG